MKNRPIINYYFSIHSWTIGNICVKYDTVMKIILLTEQQISSVSVESGNKYPIKINIKPIKNTNEKSGYQHHLYHIMIECRCN